MLFLRRCLSLTFKPKSPSLLPYALTNLIESTPLYFIFIVNFSSTTLRKVNREYPNIYLIEDFKDRSVSVDLP